MYDFDQREKALRQSIAHLSSQAEVIDTQLKMQRGALEQLLEIKASLAPPPPNGVEVVADPA